ncbi:hypothetical protein BWI93_27220 [Siphonobacter sp. BAB-5385]|uniref:hypothetical protein n=1 Tax=Siphonobacter sp. BAB-5385 TaxID=1864822 RepID=UPI000B9DEBA7|nr:hypothetical protein [Siphonobacter sp. BAB-5385]OZI05107.1 hypothetical protein BWI93_27220 [Siphonobacter sp. BAB-5385]
MRELIEAMGVMPSHLLAAVYGSLFGLLVRYVYEVIFKPKRKRLPTTERIKYNSAMFVIGTLVSVYCTEPAGEYFKREADHFLYFVVGGSGVELGLAFLRFLRSMAIMFKNRAFLIAALELLIDKLKSKKDA